MACWYIEDEKIKIVEIFYVGTHEKAHLKETPAIEPANTPGEIGIPWREAFTEGLEKFSETGLILKGGRHKAGLTQKALAEQIGVLPHHISEMEHGKRPIGKNMAHKLAKVFNVDYRVFL